MKFTLKELFGLIACVAIACGAVAWYARVPAKDPIGLFIGAIPLIIILLTVSVVFLAIMVVAVSRSRASRIEPPPAPPSRCG